MISLAHERVAESSPGVLPLRLLVLVVVPSKDGAVPESGGLVVWCSRRPVGVAQVLAFRVDPGAFIYDVIWRDPELFAIGKLFKEKWKMAFFKWCRGPYAKQSPLPQDFLLPLRQR